MSRAADVPAADPAGTGDAAAPASGFRARLLAARARVRGIPGGFLIWRIGVTLIGVVVIGIGILLLPLPGPGWLIIFGGLGLLATEYAWAAILLRRVRGLLRRWTAWTAAQPRWLQIAMALMGLIGLAAILVGVWYGYRAV